MSEHYHACIADTIAAFQNSGRAYQELRDDGTHPNDEGQKIYYKTIKTLVDTYFMQRDEIKEQNIGSVDTRLEDFKGFTYYPMKDFKKITDTTYELKLQHSPAMIGIDYTTVKGIQDIIVKVDNQKEYTINISWENDFTLDYMEIIAQSCDMISNIQLIFSTKEQAEAFHGIILNYNN